MHARLVVAALVACAAPLVAQGDCFPSGHSNEADLFAHFAVPLAFSPSVAPWIYQPGVVQVGLEGTLLPDASDRIATPTVCRPGKGPENVNILPGFVRPRIGFVLANGVQLEASWTPPVRVKQVRANLWSFALSRTVPVSRGGTMMFGRLHATIGSVKAPFTCPDEALLDATSECFGGKRSDDRLSPNIFGVELGLVRSMAKGRFRPYLGGGYNILHPRFQVNFTNAVGSTDRRKVTVNLSRFVVFGGATVSLTPGFNISGEAYAAPSDEITGRVRLNLVLGRNRH